MEDYRPTVNFMVAQNYVDFEDIDNPLKQVLNEVFIEDLLIEPYKDT